MEMSKKLTDVSPDYEKLEEWADQEMHHVLYEIVLDYLREDCFVHEADWDMLVSPTIWIYDFIKRKGTKQEFFEEVINLSDDEETFLDRLDCYWEGPLTMGTDKEAATRKVLKWFGFTEEEINIRFDEE